MQMFDLTGKTAVVTGAKRGIGRGMAEALAAAGADIVGVSATLETEGSEVGKAVEAMGRSFKGYSCDFSDRAALRGFAAPRRAIRALPRERAGLGRARRGQDLLYRLAADLPGRDNGAGLRGLQGRERAAHKGARERMGAPRG